MITGPLRKHSMSLCYVRKLLSLLSLFWSQIFKNEMCNLNLLDLVLSTGLNLLNM